MGFFQVDNAFFEEGYAARLKPVDIAVYFLLKKYANGSGECWPSVQTICAKLGVKSRTTVGAALERLEQEKLIALTPSEDDARKYVFRVLPLGVSDAEVCPEIGHTSGKKRRIRPVIGHSCVQKLDIPAPEGKIGPEIEPTSAGDMSRNWTEICPEIEHKEYPCNKTQDSVPSERDASASHGKPRLRRARDPAKDYTKKQSLGFGIKNLSGLYVALCRWYRPNAKPPVVQDVDRVALRSALEGISSADGCDYYDAETQLEDLVDRLASWGKPLSVLRWRLDDLRNGVDLTRASNGTASTGRSSTGREYRRPSDARQGAAAGARPAVDRPRTEEWRKWT